MHSANQLRGDQLCSEAGAWCQSPDNRKPEKEKMRPLLRNLVAVLKLCLQLLSFLLPLFLQMLRKMATAMPGRGTSHFLPALALLLALDLFGLSTSSSLGLDLGVLLDFRAGADPTNKLRSWNRSDPEPCATWYGVSCAQGRVTQLVLEGMSLSGMGGLVALTKLDQLRVLSLKWNALSGPIPDLSSLHALKLLFLSHNSFSGSIPSSLASLSRLYRLDLSYNNLSGPIPPALAQLSNLLTLRLDSNVLSGPIPQAVSFPNLQDLNLSSNALSGPIPRAFSAFPPAAFAANPALCGAPLPSCPEAVSDPTRSRLFSPAAAPPVPLAAAAVSSSPRSKPEVAPAGSSLHHPAPGISHAAVVAIVAGDFVALVLVSGLLFCYFWRRSADKNSPRLQEGEKIVYSSSPYVSQAAAAAAGTGGGFERGRMVFLEGTNRFELEDLLRASAETLGKGGYGTAYKAALDDGSVVAVKRLREVQVAGKREFEHHMETLSRLRHPNLVPLKAYYYSRDEKLLVFDFMPNGSLFSLLYGNRGPGRTPLDWLARMRIAAGAARGLAYLHHYGAGGGWGAKLAHGNVKSTNVLLDKAGNARLADVGLALLGPPCAGARGGGYRAPEAPGDGARGPWATRRADVYAFGVVLLELLTGRPACEVDLPRWVASVVREEWTAEVFDLELMRYKGIEEEMVSMLQVAMACTAASPDQRPSIAHVLRSIEEIRGGDASPSHESLDSVSDSPSVSEGATQ